MEAALYNQLVLKLRTKADIASVLVVLEEFTASFFSSQSLEQQQQLFRKLPPETAEILIAALAKEQITPNNQISIKRQIDELTTKLKTCKLIQLTLAFQPDEVTVTLFSDWIKKNIQPDLLIDLQFDKTIVGGALLIANGVYKDYSVRKRLSNRFQIQRDEIMKLIN